MVQERVLTGYLEVDAMLAELSSAATANRIARSGLFKGVRLASKRMKQRIPSHQKSARLAIGHSVKRAKYGDSKGTTVAKAGAGVGKPSKAQRRRVESRDTLGKPGVGISARNIHWFIMGTKKRWTGQKTGRTRIGGKTANIPVLTGAPRRYRGKMPPSPVVKEVAQSHGQEIATTVKKGISDAFQREVARLRKK